MTLIPLNLGLGSNPGRDNQVSGVRHVNCYVTIQPESKSGRVIYPTPGLKRWDDGAFTGGIRALIKRNESALVSVVGNRVIEYGLSGASTAKSSLVGSGRLYSALNMKSTEQICFVTTDKQAFLYESGSVTQITDPDLRIPNDVTWLDGYFIFTHEDGTFSITSLNEGANIDPGDFATAESQPDALVRGFAHGGLLYLLGTTSLEIWQNTGNSTFPFEPTQSDIGFGCMAGQTVQSMHEIDSVVFVDHNGVVRAMQGTTPARISNTSLEREISKLSDDDKASLEADVFRYEADEIYCLQSPGNWTWCFNATTKTWFELESYGQDDWRATYSAFFNNKWLIGSRSSGDVYHIDHETFQEDSNHHVFRIFCPVVHGYPGRRRASKLFIDCIRGQGLNTSDEHNSDPQLFMRYSDNGSNHFTAERRRSMGKQGEYKTLVQFNNLGQVTPNGRVFEFYSSAAVNKGILSAQLDIA